MIIVPLPRELRKGMKGTDVLMVKRAISRAGYRRWGVGFTVSFGPILEKNVKQFQKDNGLTPDGVYGKDTHAKLAKHYDSYGIKRMVSLMPQTPDPVKFAIMGYNYRQLIYYSQGYDRMTIIRNKIRDLAAWFKSGRTITEDCSSYVTACYWLARKPDPNGYVPGYPGMGYTGTLSVHGVKSKTAVLGALGFYGWGWPYRHVVIVVGFKNGKPIVVSHGGSSGPLMLAYDYRYDFSHWRVYK